MRDLRDIPIDDIVRRSDARPLDEATVFGIADSITQTGRLFSPLIVRPSGKTFELLAGSHRLAACDSLDWRTVPAFVVDDDDPHAELVMLDENLFRNEPGPAERARMTARRKALYELLHPETRHGGDRIGVDDDAGEAPAGKTDVLGEGEQVAKLATSKSPTFSKDTARKTGQSERAVRRDAERGERVIDEALNLVRGTKLDTGAYLDKLKRMAPNDQVTAVKRDLAQIKRDAEAPPPQRQAFGPRGAEGRASRPRPGPAQAVPGTARRARRVQAY